MNAKDAFEYIKKAAVCPEYKEFARGVVERLTGEKDKKEPVLNLKKLYVELQDYSPEPTSGEVFCRDSNGERWHLFSIYADGTFKRVANINKSSGWKLDDLGRMMEMELGL